MKYLKMVLLLGCIIQITNISYTISELADEIAQALYPKLYNESPGIALAKVNDQANVISQEKNISLSTAFDQLGANISNFDPLIMTDDAIPNYEKGKHRDFPPPTSTSPTQKLESLSTTIHQPNQPVSVYTKTPPSIESNTQSPNKNLSKLKNSYTEIVNLPLPNLVDSAPLWIAVNIDGQIHVIINNDGSGLNIGNNWKKEYLQPTMKLIQSWSALNLKISGITFSLINQPNDGVYVYVTWAQTGKYLGHVKLEGIKKTLPAYVIWSGSYINPVHLNIDTTFIYQTPTASGPQISIPPFASWGK
ncbi:hypothetical protein HYV10_03655 [Candidatus Dependentiae bacterium]|nr:hypothetical protein [Candidatus Dependentiae bacterium]